MNIKAWLAIKGITLKELSKATGISYGTLIYKIKDVSKFTVEEYRAVCEFTDMPDDISIGIMKRK